MTKPLILAIDQGTSATKCLLVDDAGRVLARGSAPLGEAHPRPGWVEQDAEALWTSVREAVRACLDGQDASALVGIGLSTQRESVVAWDGATGKPLAPLLSWQDQRTAARGAELRTPAHDRLVRERSGLPLDPMFSALKAGWLLDTLDADRSAARAGRIRLGTVDAWLIACLTGAHLIEAGNASRTQLLDVRKAAWDADLLDLFNVPRAALPEVVASIGPFPPIAGLPAVPPRTRLLAVMGDSHAALFAHGATAPGQVKATYGTGSSVMGLIDEPATLESGLCNTIAWAIEAPALAAEGNIRASGATLKWLADLLAVTPAELAALGAKARSEGVVLVPGFNGLGAPWWDSAAVGLIGNLTLGSSREALARAALEAIVHQVTDVVEAMDRGVGRVERLHVDGGPTRNDMLMQLQADIAGRPVLRANDTELSALGVAHLAGLAAGVWSLGDLAALRRDRDTFVPALADTQRARERAQWRRGVARARGEKVANAEALA
jgi:glycerol kinase